MILRFLSLLLIASFVIRTLKSLLYQSYIWQLKEYRLDRMFSFLKTDVGRRTFFSPLSLLKWVLIILGVMAVIYSYGLFLLFLYLCFWILWIIESVKGGWRVPKFTLKIWLIVILTSSLIFSWFYIEDLGFFLTYGPILDKLLTSIIFINVLTINLFGWFIKKFIVYLAKRKINKMKNLTVIGITGSYGKTSTCEFLNTILSEKYNVLKTEGYNNTEIAVALNVLKKLEDAHEIFIVEMGAYKKGEIRAICNIVHPKIGIITGINAQHIELFGSIEKTIEAKFELIKGLRKNGEALFNLNNNYVQEMYVKAKNERKDLKCLGFSEKISYRITSVTTDSITFELPYKDKEIKCQTKMHGKQNIENVVAASLIALGLGFSLTQIKKSVSKLKPPPHTMRLIYRKDKHPLIDDTFNSNPDGVIAALEYLSLFPQKKYIVLTPLIELGKEAESVHQLISEKASKICERIFLTNQNYYGSFKDKAEILKNKELPKDGVILFEGKEAGKILEKYV